MNRFNLNEKDKPSKLQKVEDMLNQASNVFLEDIDKIMKRDD